MFKVKIKGILVLINTNLNIFSKKAIVKAIPPMKYKNIK